MDVEIAVDAPSDGVVVDVAAGLLGTAPPSFDVLISAQLFQDLADPAVLTTHPVLPLEASNSFHVAQQHQQLQDELQHEEGGQVGGIVSEGTAVIGVEPLVPLACTDFAPPGLEETGAALALNPSKKRYRNKRGFSDVLVAQCTCNAEARCVTHFYHSIVTCACHQARMAGKSNWAQEIGEPRPPRREEKGALCVRLGGTLEVWRRHIHGRLEDREDRG